MNKKVIKYLKLLVVVVIIALFLWFVVIKPSYNFKQYENQLEKAGQRYFDLNSTELPTGNRVATVTMQTLYHKAYLEEDFYIPYTDEPCNLKESWVKVRKIDGKYKYYTYLQCGAMKSSVDNKGPEIKLNGPETITIDLGDEYKEPGVKSVVDNGDGKLDVKNVTINSKKVDPNKVGTYEVTYTALDGLKNKTTVTRKVEVISKIRNAVNIATEKKGYYVGTEVNNYVKLSSMLFRIIGIEGKNVKVVADEDIANVNYSGITKWLDDYYMKHLSEESKKLLVKNKYCNMTISKETQPSKECTSFTKERYVYIPSITDVEKTQDELRYTFMKPTTISWLSNASDKDNAYTTRNIFFGTQSGASYYIDSKTKNYGVRPVLTIDGDTLVKKGNGTRVSPYEFGEIKTGKPDELVNTRYTGEYINYGGLIWRIVEVNNDGTTKIVSVENIKQEGTNITTSNEGITTLSVIYNPKQKGNVGYYINNKSSEFIDTSYFVNKEVSVPIYSKDIQYGKEKSTKKYTVKLSAPNMYEMFSAKATMVGSTKSYWLINSSKADLTKAVVTDAGVVITDKIGNFDSYGIRVVANLKKSVNITKGNGTLASPYNISK